MRTISSSFEQGTNAATSARLSSRSLPYLAGMQPLTITGMSAPTDSDRPIASNTASMLSSVALCMNEHVFTMIRSLAAPSSTIVAPAERKRPLMRAESTSFFAQPMVTIATFTPASTDDTGMLSRAPSTFRATSDAPSEAECSTIFVFMDTISAFSICSSQIATEFRNPVP